MAGTLENPMVPHLITALTGPINELEQRVLESMPAIERWFRLEWMEHTPAFYSAVSLRNAGFKLAPVDTQLHPVGFHHLSEAMLPLAVQAAMAAIEKICPEAKNLLLIPDPRRRSAGALASLATLVRIFHQAGLNVRLGALEEGLEAPVELPLAEGGSLRLEPLLRKRGRLLLKDFDPCTILLNCELADGVPQILKNLDEQYLLPPLHASAALRSRSTYLATYEEVAKRFAKLLGMDPWLINPVHAQCEAPDFRSGAGLQALQEQVETILGKVRKKYKDYGINEKPFVVLKADAARGGLGTLAVRDAKELEGAAWPALAAPARLLIQEGVATHERLEDVPVEPTVYLLDRYVIGGYYRELAEPGQASRPVPLAFADSAQLVRPGERAGASAPNRFYMYGVVARLAMLAASYELEQSDPDREELESALPA